MLLAGLTGGLALDRFNLGQVGSGVAELLTGGGLGAWAVVDALRTALGNRTDAEGRPLVGREQHKVAGWVIFAVHCAAFLFPLVYLVILGMFLVAALVGATGGSSSANFSTTASQAQDGTSDSVRVNTSPLEIVADGNALVVDDLRMEVVTTYTPSRWEPMHYAAYPPEGDWLEVEMSFTNGAEHNTYLYPEEFRLALPDGTVQDADDWPARYLDGPVADGILEPGDEVRGAILFPIPSGVSVEDLTLLYEPKGELETVEFPLS